MRTIKLSDYAQMRNKDHQWLIRGYVPKPAIILLTGEAKAGKTSLAIQLALALGRGDQFFGQPAVRSKALFFQCDMSEFILRNVLQDYMRCGLSLEGEVFIPHPDDMVYGINVLLPEHREYLRLLRQSCDPDVVFLDVLAELHSADEQNSIAMKEVVNALLSVFSGTTLVIVHHNRKPPQPYGPNAIRPPIDLISASRGTSYLPGRADSVWMVDATSDGTKGTLRIKGRLGPPRELALRRLPSGLWAPA